MFKTSPFNYKQILQYIKTNIELYGWSKPVNQQIRSIWTTYCLWHDTHVDTYAYDTKLREIYNEIVLKLGLQIANIDELKTFDNFDMFMCEYLV